VQVLAALNHPGLIPWDRAHFVYTGVSCCPAAVAAAAAAAGAAAVAAAAATAITAARQALLGLKVNNLTHKFCERHKHLNPALVCCQRYVVDGVCEQHVQHLQPGPWQPLVEHVTLSKQFRASMGLASCSLTTHWASGLQAMADTMGASAAAAAEIALTTIDPAPCCTTHRCSHAALLVMYSR
jgi:hypothetical protein